MKGRRAAHADETTDARRRRRRRRDRRAELAERADRRHDLAGSDGRDDRPHPHDDGAGRTDRGVRAGQDDDHDRTDLADLADRDDRPRRRSWLRRLVNVVLTAAFVFAALCAAYVLLSDRPITLAVGVVLAVTALVAVVLMDGRGYEEEILDEDEDDDAGAHDAATRADDRLDAATRADDDHAPDDALDAAARGPARGVDDPTARTDARYGSEPGASTPIDAGPTVEPATGDHGRPPTPEPEPVLGAVTTPTDPSPRPELATEAESAARPAVGAQPSPPAATVEVVPTAPPAPTVVAPAAATGPSQPHAAAATPTGAAPGPSGVPAPGLTPTAAASTLPTAAPSEPSATTPAPALRLDEVVEVATATRVGAWVAVERGGAAPLARTEAELLAVLDAVLPDPTRPAGAVGVTVAADALSAGVTPALVARCTAAGLRPDDLVLEVVLDGAEGGQAAAALGALDAAGVRLAWESRDLDLAALAAVAHLPWSWIVVGTDGLGALGPIGAHAARITAGIAHDLGFDAVVRTGPAAEPTVDASGFPFRFAIRRPR